MSPEMWLVGLGVTILAVAGGFHGVFKFITEDDMNSWASRVACLEVVLAIIVLSIVFSAFLNA